MKAKEALPTDYEVCGTCGYDHAYDFPLLSEDERLRAYHDHIVAGMRGEAPVNFPHEQGKI